MRLFSFLFLIFALGQAGPASAHSEKKHVEALCKDMRQEMTNIDRTRIDCLHPVFAIEVDFSHKWAEGIGQALYYAALYDRRPGLILICGHRKKLSTCKGHVERAVKTLHRNEIDSQVWFCLNGDRRLALCESTRIQFPSRYSR